MSTSVLIDIRNITIEREEISPLIVSIAKIIKSLLIRAKTYTVVFKDKDVAKELGMDFTYNGVICWKNSNVYSAIKQMLIVSKKIVVVTNTTDVINLISSPIIIDMSAQGLGFQSAIKFNNLPGVGYNRYPNIPLHNPVDKVYCFIDWQNIQVPLDDMPTFLKSLRKISIDKFNPGAPLHIFLFLSSLTCNRKKLYELQKLLYKEDVHCMYVEHKKPGAADTAILVSAEGYLESGCGMIMVSGDIDFAPYLTKMARRGLPIALIYNNQAWNTYRANKHFIYSENFENLDGFKYSKMGELKNRIVLDENRKSKVCRHFNYTNCNQSNTVCTFDHKCHCGGDHSYKDVHPNLNILEFIPCTNWNFGEPCLDECLFAHVCSRCFKHGHCVGECTMEFNCISCHEKFPDALELELHLLKEHKARKPVCIGESCIGESHIGKV